MVHLKRTESLILGYFPLPPPSLSIYISLSLSGNEFRGFPINVKRIGTWTHESLQHYLWMCTRLTLIENSICLRTLVDNKERIRPDVYRKSRI